MRQNQNFTWIAHSQNELKWITSLIPLQSTKTRRIVSRPSTRMSTARTTWSSRRPPTTGRWSSRRSSTTWASPTRSSTTPAPSRSPRGRCRRRRRRQRHLGTAAAGGWVGSHASSLLVIHLFERWPHVRHTSGLIFLQRSTWGKEGRTTRTTRAELRKAQNKKKDRNRRIATFSCNKNFSTYKQDNMEPIFILNYSREKETHTTQNNCRHMSKTVAYTAHILFYLKTLLLLYTYSKQAITI